MATPDPITPDTRCFAIRLPRLLWIGVATLAAVVVGVKIGMPIARRHAAISEIERLRDSNLPMDKRKATAIAMSYFADKNGGRPIDAEYSASRDPDGYCVIVSFIRERDCLGRPQHIIGDFCSLTVSELGEVVDVQGGE